ncbi:hypothetical protein ACROYT_G016339 [Oculina patagonica]
MTYYLRNMKSESFQYFSKDTCYKNNYAEDNQPDRYNSCSPAQWDVRIYASYSSPFKVIQVVYYAVYFKAAASNFQKGLRDFQTIRS